VAPGKLPSPICCRRRDDLHLDVYHELLDLRLGLFEAPLQVGDQLFRFGDQAFGFGGKLFGSPFKSIGISIETSYILFRFPSSIPLTAGYSGEPAC
jgi:hypothetical protein